MDSQSACTTRSLRTILPSCIKGHRRVVSAPMDTLRAMLKPDGSVFLPESLLITQQQQQPCKDVVSKKSLWEHRINGVSIHQHGDLENGGSTRSRGKTHHQSANSRSGRKEFRGGGRYGNTAHYNAQQRVVISQNMNAEELSLFRTQICPRKTQDDSCTLEECCPFSHCLSWHRRNPQVTGYRPGLCPNVVFSIGPNRKMKVRNYCRRGRLCLYSHTKEEQMYHPLVYKTHLCRDWPNCNKHFCPFAHGIAELRTPQQVNFRLALGPEKPELPMEMHRASLVNGQERKSDGAQQQKLYKLLQDQKGKCRDGKGMFGRKVASGPPVVAFQAASPSFDFAELNKGAKPEFGSPNTNQHHNIARSTILSGPRVSNQSDSTTTSLAASDIGLGLDSGDFGSFKGHERAQQTLGLNRGTCEKQQLTEALYAHSNVGLEESQNLNEDLLNIVAAGMVLLMQGGGSECNTTEMANMFCQGEQSVSSERPLSQGDIVDPTLSEALDFLQVHDQVSRVQHPAEQVYDTAALEHTDTPLHSGDVMQSWTVLRRSAGLDSSIEKHLGQSEEILRQSTEPLLWRSPINNKAHQVGLVSEADYRYGLMCQQKKDYNEMPAEQFTTEFTTDFSNDAMRLTTSEMIALAEGSYGRILNELGNGIIQSPPYELSSRGLLPDVPERQPYFCSSHAVFNQRPALKRTTQSSTTIGGCSMGSEESSVLSFETDRIFADEQLSLEFATNRGSLLQQHASAPDLSKMSSPDDGHPSLEELYSNTPEFRTSVSLQRMSHVLAAELQDMAESTRPRNDESGSSCGTYSISLKSSASSYTAASSP